MREIGGYIELDTYTGKMLHNDGIKLNCGRNALAYLIETKEIKKLAMPRFMCDSCDGVLEKYKITIRYYDIDTDFKPVYKRLDDEWLYVVNYYGQLTNDYLISLGKNIIVDNAHAYFQKPLSNIDTLYTCRKFFGVPDGAILYSNCKRLILKQDQSYDRMEFLLGRYEKTASDFYDQYVANNRRFKFQPIKRMSKLTENLLNGIDYSHIKKVRTENFIYLNEHLKKINKLSLIIPDGPFMYPLYIENGDAVRKELLKQRIYIPILWPAVFEKCKKNELAYDMALNILPLPIDQRYSLIDMKYLIETIIRYQNI